MQKISDALRYICVYDYGDIYMDLDQLFFKNYDLKALIPFVVQFSNVPFSPQKNMANDRHRNI